MAARVPLNKFRNRHINVSTGLSGVYTAPQERAAILINAHAANPTNNDISITMMVSAVDIYSGSSGYTFFPIVSSFPIPARDARSLVTGRVVLQGVDGASITTPDILVVKADSDGLVLSLGLLETKNTD